MKEISLCFIVNKQLFYTFSALYIRIQYNINNYENLIIGIKSQ